MGESIVALGAHAAKAEADPIEDFYRGKEVSIIISSSPGGGYDTLARTIGQHLSERLGQPILVESRTGAGGVIGVAPPAGTCSAVAAVAAIRAA